MEFRAGTREVRTGLYHFGFLVRTKKKKIRAERLKHFGTEFVLSDSAVSAQLFVSKKEISKSRDKGECNYWGVKLSALNFSYNRSLVMQTIMVTGLKEWSVSIYLKKSIILELWLEKSMNGGYEYETEQVLTFIMRCDEPPSEKSEKGV